MLLREQSARRSYLRWVREWAEGHGEPLPPTFECCPRCLTPWLTDVMPRPDLADVEPGTVPDQ